jgi:hypothetical protein
MAAMLSTGDVPEAAPTPTVCEVGCTLRLADEAFAPLLPNAHVLWHR